MALTYSTGGSGGGDFKSVPPGSHIAVCDIVADIGLQPGSAAYPAPKQKVYMRFEIPNERVEYTKDGQKMEGPAVIGSFFTASMHEKATLRIKLEGWRGKKFTDEQAAKFDVSSILGKPCMLTVVEDVKGDKVYANIASISPLPKGIGQAPVAETDLLFYSNDQPGQYNQLPEWLRKKIDGQIVPEEKVNHDSEPFEASMEDVAF